MNYPDRLNCAEVLLDRALLEISPDKPAILYGDERWSYAQLQTQVNRTAWVLTQDFGIIIRCDSERHRQNSAAK